MEPAIMVVLGLLSPLWFGFVLVSGLLWVERGRRLDELERRVVRLEALVVEEEDGEPVIDEGGSGLEFDEALKKLSNSPPFFGSVEWFDDGVV